MSQSFPIPTEEELIELRRRVQHIQEKEQGELAAQAKRQEKDALIQTIEEATYKAVTQPTEYDSAMAIADTDKVLKTRRTSKRWLDRVFQRLMAMGSLRPISAHLIALTLAGLAVVGLVYWVDVPFIEPYKPFGIHIIQVIGAIQILKSSTRSIALPLLAMGVGCIMGQKVTGSTEVFFMNHNAFSLLTLVGVIGLAFSVLAMD